MLANNLAYSGWEANLNEASMTATIDRLGDHRVILELSVPTKQAEQAPERPPRYYKLRQMRSGN